MRTLAALATIPGRERELEQCLAALRPQVDVLRVVCHSRETPPASVLKYADQWDCCPDVHGSGAKMRWSQEWKGLYFVCDDDALYPPDYVKVMSSWVRKFDGRALVTCHGRILKPDADGFRDRSFAKNAFDDTYPGWWVNYPGSFGLAFDSTVLTNVPNEPAVKSTEEPTLAVWAQENQVPIWLVPHKADWLKYLQPPGPQVWHEEKSTGFERRNGVLHQHRGIWKVYEL